MPEALDSGAAPATRGAFVTAIDRAWRVFATGLSFTVFGIGGLVLRFLWFPLLQIFVRDRARRQVWVRRTVQRAFAGFVELMRCLGVLRYEIHGIERLQRRGLLILANHPTLIDVVFLISRIPNADCIVKSALLDNPVMRGPVTAAGYVFNDEGSGLIDDCVAAVRRGGNLVAFPEGTRTRRGQPLKLQRGAAHVALRGGFDITPVYIDCVPMTLGKGEKWYRVPPRRVLFTMRVGEDIAIAPFAADPQGEAVAARRLTAHLADLFSGDTREAGPRDAGS